MKRPGPYVLVPSCAAALIALLAATPSSAQAPPPATSPPPLPAAPPPAPTEPPPHPTTPPSAAVDIPAPPETLPGPEPEDPKGPWMMIYGFAMTDIGYDFGHIDPDWYDVMRPTKLPSFDERVRPGRPDVRRRAPDPLRREGGRPDVARRAQDNLRVRAVRRRRRRRPDDVPPAPRLRRARVSFGAGQTWSPFMDIDVFPNSIEYWGPNGMVFFRNVQVRWMPIQGDSRVTFAARAPGRDRRHRRVLTERVELDDIISRFPMPGLLRRGPLRRLAGATSSWRASSATSSGTTSAPTPSTCPATRSAGA